VELAEKKQKIRDLIAYEFGVLPKRIEMTQTKIKIVFDREELNIADVGLKKVADKSVKSISDLLGRSVEIDFEEEH